MNNLIYHTNGKCPCGGHSYVSAVYVEEAAGGAWHVMIEEQCHDCDRLDVTDIPWLDVISDPEMAIAAQASYDQHQESEK